MAKSQKTKTKKPKPLRTSNHIRRGEETGKKGWGGGVAVYRDD